MQLTKTEQKREQEKATIHFMISLYCRKKHGSQEMCEDCRKLYDYACTRIDHCPFMETKTFCSSCKVHCYASEQRVKIKEIMRFSGPRMLLYHPFMAMHHIIQTIKEKHL